MKSSQWREYLEDQHVRHGKTLYTITELTHVAGVSPVALNVELSRLRKHRIIEKYAHGLYGRPGAVSLETLVQAIDSHAYLSGHYALQLHNIVLQVPTIITCVTDRRSPRARRRTTPLGRLEFVCVQSRVYAPPQDGLIAMPAQALCDFLYLSRRRGVRPESLVAFTHLNRIDSNESANVLVRYPQTVQRHFHELLRSAGSATCGN
ncbi:MAG: hypothetical protein R3E01_19910 [Pirellulaceae bacterium]|nr:hypothetical protein [Planctomycetales bacterium]